MQNMMQLLLLEDEKMIETLSTYAAQKPVLATWVIRSKKALRDGERLPSTACKHRRVGVQSEIVNSILMHE